MHTHAHAQGQTQLGHKTRTHIKYKVRVLFQYLTNIAVFRELSLPADPGPGPEVVLHIYKTM